MIAFQILSIVFGDVGTSPLYTFSVMFTKAPINGDEDVLGALSLVLYTLILIPLIKYVLIVLWANDDGEGIIFFSLHLLLLVIYLSHQAHRLVLLPSIVFLSPSFSFEENFCLQAVLLPCTH